MKILHEKSQCCAARIVRFGGKRRQCTACKKTWSIHPAKRGPKPVRAQRDYLDKVFNHGLRVKHLALHSALSADAIYKRFNKQMASVVQRRRIVRIRGEHLMIIIDAKWRYFKRTLWTLYFIAVKPTGAETAIVLDPVLRCGKESATAWREIIATVPAGIKKRSIALVSDGIRGIERIAGDNGWILQRCHFHLLSMLQRRRGKRASTPGRFVRQEIYASVEQALVETDTHRLDTLCRRLAILAQHQCCPRQMRMIVRDFLRRLPDFRAYLAYPELHLPTTTNVMESINSFVTEKTNKTRTPDAWYRWAVACVRIKSKFTCK